MVGGQLGWKGGEGVRRQGEKGDMRRERVQRVARRRDGREAGCAGHSRVAWAHLPQLKPPLGGAVAEAFGLLLDAAELQRCAAACRSERYAAARSSGESVLGGAPGKRGRWEARGAGVSALRARTSTSHSRALALPHLRLHRVHLDVSRGTAAHALKARGGAVQRAAWRMHCVHRGRLGAGRVVGRRRRARRLSAGRLPAEPAAKRERAGRAPHGRARAVGWRL